MLLSLLHIACLTLLGCFLGGLGFASRAASDVCLKSLASQPPLTRIRLRCFSALSCSGGCLWKITRLGLQCFSACHCSCDLRSGCGSSRIAFSAVLLGFLFERCFSPCVLVLLVAAVVGLRGRSASQPAGFCRASHPPGLVGFPLHGPLLSALRRRKNSDDDDDDDDYCYYY